MDASKKSIVKFNAKVRACVFVRRERILYTENCIRWLWYWDQIFAVKNLLKLVKLLSQEPACVSREAERNVPFITRTFLNAQNKLLKKIFNIFAPIVFESPITEEDHKFYLSPTRVNGLNNREPMEYDMEYAAPFIVVEPLQIDYSNDRI